VKSEPLSLLFMTDKNTVRVWHTSQ